MVLFLMRLCFKMYHVTEKLYIVSWIVEIPISFLKNHGISTSDIEKGGEEWFLVFQKMVN